MKRYLDLIKSFGNIKKIKRQGWVREGIINDESVADHSFRVAIMAMFFGEKLDVDTNKLIRMALIHDVAEGIKGDKVVERGKNIDTQSREEKDKEEIEILKQIFGDIQEGEEFIKIQEEISEGKTKEAKVFKQLERLEMAAQAFEYEEEYGKDLSEFFENTLLYISHPFLKELIETIKTIRSKKEN
jgi:5'-deoxynucleotidase YfbR-like HD superfamily hydrolase